MKKLVCMLVLVAETAWAGTTGKIAGKVVDASSQQPLPSVNVQIVGTSMGATTDANGNYFILNVPVGTYSLKASMVGYAAQTISTVKVFVDLTTMIDFQLETSDIQMRDVVVTAERPAIQQDRTSTKHTVDQDAINALPVDDFREVVQLQAGVVGSHFRGGRFNEALFLVDGIPVKSAVNGYTAYTGGLSINIPQLGVSEIQVTTGGFEAEYGNAQSGIINTLTRDPSSRLSTKLRVRTSDFPWTKMKWRPNEFGNGLPDWKNYEAFLSSPAITLGGFRVALSGSADISKLTRDFLPHENSFRESYQAKLSFSSADSRIILSGLRSWSTGNSYYHRYSRFGPLSEGYQKDLYQQITTINGVKTLEQYIFVPDPQNYHNVGAPDSALYLSDSTWYKNVRNIYQAGMENNISVPVNQSYNIGFLWTQTLNNHSFIDVKLSQFWTNFREIVRDVNDRNGNGSTSDELYWGLNGGPGGYTDRKFMLDYWYFTGDEGWYLNQVARTTSMRIDYSNQFNQTNLLKAGMELSYDQGDVEKVTFESVLSPRFDIWRNELVDVAAYVQDKIEVRGGFILNAGIRFDYFNPNGFGPSVYYPADPAELADPARRQVLTSADKIESHWQISPRIGVSHPITERDKIHFYYGHFFQRPDMRYLYENSNDLVRAFRYITNVDIGNPRLRPEKTVSYEVGWEHLFSDFVRLEVTGYFKDITNLVAANDYDFPGAAAPFQAYGNLDYANVRGLEFTLESVGVRSIGGMINYTYSFANGRSSSVFRGNGEILPRRLDPLDWDVRHKINANLLIRSAGLIDKIIGDAEVNFVFTAQSGLPYTTNTRDVFPLFALRNDGRLPWTKNVDLRFRKTFMISMIDLSLLLEVRNLFNWINVEYIAGGREGLITFEQTRDTPNIDPTGPYHDPNAWSRPRVYRLGLEIQL